MIGLRTPRNSVAKSVSLLQRVKENIDVFRKKIKTDREEIKSRVEDIALLKVVFADLDDILNDFNTIYPGDVLIKEWDFLFPQMIQSLIDVENFMKNRFLPVEGFNPNIELSAFISFKESIKRIKKLGVGQFIKLEPSVGSNVSISSKISDAIATRILEGPPHPLHPGHCLTTSIPPIPQNQLDWMRLFAGIYKIGPLKGVVPNTGIPNPFPAGSDEGFMSIGFGTQAALDPDSVTYADLGKYWGNSIAIECTESTKFPQHTGPYSSATGLLAPNTSDGGCGRRFSGGDDGYYPYISTLGSGTILIYPVNAKTSGEDWVRYSYESVGVCIDCCYIHVSDLMYLEGSHGASDLFNLKQSAYCGSDCHNPERCEQECVSVLDEPHYYYVFFDFEYDPGNNATWFLEEKITANDSSISDFYGQSVSISGDVAIVGSPGDDAHGSNSGSAYMYEFNGSSWQETKITDTYGNEDDQFGKSVYVDGIYAMVGSTSKEVSGIANAGKVFAYKFNGSSWDQTDTMTLSEPSAHDRFGTSICISGNLAIIGTPGAEQNGVAHIYKTTNGTSWSQVTKLTPDNSFSTFGSSVSISGDTAVVGHRGNQVHEAVSVFRFNGASWELEDKIHNSCSSIGYGCDFGYSVSVQNNKIAVGAPDSGGSAYVYARNNGNWELEVDLGSLPDFNFMGSSISIDNDTIVVGACHQNAISEGAVGVYSFNGIEWSQEAFIVASDGSSSDGFGWRVGVSGDKLISGAHGDAGQAGSAYIYSRTYERNYEPPSNPGEYDLLKMQEKNKKE